MFKNYLKIAWRNLWRQKGFSLINIGGLAIGLTAFFLIMLYVSFEMSYDNFHTKGDNIYRVVTDIKTPTDVMESDRPSIAVPPRLETDFEEVQKAVRIMDITLDIRKNNIKFKEPNSMAVDSAFFGVFDFALVQGDKRNALKEPFSIVLTKEVANKYFGDGQAIGQTLKIKNEDIDDRNFTVTGIMEEMPANSHIQADILISMTTYSQGVMPEFDNLWGLYDPSAYVLLNSASDPKRLESKFLDFIERNIGNELRADKMAVTLKLEPLNTVYLVSTRGGKISGDVNLIYIFSVVALFILIIACINFINLTTARSVERAKEVGVRKVIGAGKRQLGFQFIGESVIICLIAFVFTVLLTIFVLPQFSALAGKTIVASVFDITGHFAVLFIITLAVGVLAGSYPAFVLSSFRPVSVLKGSFLAGNKGVTLRKVLVVAQFSISIALIVGTVIIYNQMNFMQNQDLGFNKERLVVLETDISPQLNVLKEDLKKLPGVISTGLSSSVPGIQNNSAYSIIENNSGDDQVANLDAYFVDYDFVSQFGLKVIAGRDFSKDFASDSTEAMIVNEQTVKLFGYSNPSEALGAKFSQWGKEGQIIGVVKDFHFKSLQDNIKPMTMAFGKEKADLLAVKIRPDDVQATLAGIQLKWESILPNDTFNYYFLDQAFDRQYRAQERFGNLFLAFAFLAILISCLGLLGLAAYSTLQRKREIGIRKVIGSSVLGIVHLVSKEFLKLIAISFLIATPIAWFVMDAWLQDFAYRIEVQWWVFALAGIFTLAIAILTVSFHAFKAAIANPVKSLRAE